MHPLFLLSLLLLLLSGIFSKRTDIRSATAINLSHFHSLQKIKAKNKNIIKSKEAFPTTKKKPTIFTFSAQQTNKNQANGHKTHKLC